MSELRPNRIKHKLADGEIATVLQGELTPDLIELLGPSGFDGMWIEGEHGPTDFGDIRDMTRACDLWGLTSVARVNLNLPGVIYRTLDQGAQAIVMPHVNTSEEARSVVDSAKFHPIGSRGAYTSRQGIGVDNYFAKANDETAIMVLVEDIVAVGNLDAMLEIDHIDVFFVAAGDLAQSMGHPGNPSHPDVVKVADNAISKIVRAGRVAGSTSTRSTVGQYIEKGVRLVTTSYGDWLKEGASDFLSRI